ncbi:MAG: SurA N-terminal domain-containing protein [Albidovulum sp.]
MSTPLRKKGGSTVIWILIALMLLGLGGFGVTSFSSSATEIGRVGDRKITVNEYANALQREIRAFSAQMGQNISFAQAQALGLDRTTQAQIIAAATLENEAHKLGLSVGDAAVRERIVTAPALQGPDGTFDRGAYNIYLNDQGLSEAEFEKSLRAEAARTLLQGAVLGGVAVPDAQVDRLTAWAAETRSFTFSELLPSDLAEPVAPPSDAAIQGWYDAHGDAYMRPELRKITYAWLAPDDLVDSVEVDDQALQDLYDQRKAEFVLPERRLVERLVYPTSEQATAAKARFDQGEVSFEDLARERGLSLDDIDLGEATPDELGTAAEPVFALEAPGVVGPIDTDLGPALFAMNGILAAQTTTFEEARTDLRSEVAIDRARRQINDQVETIQDILAGGASLADLANETDMKLGAIDYSGESEGGISGYEAFRTAAEAATTDSFPTLEGLDDGGVFALQLDAIDPPALRPLDEVREQVIADWTADETQKRLVALAGESLAQLENGANLQGMGLITTHYDAFARGGFIADASPEIGAAVFEMTAGSSRVIEADGGVYLVTLESLNPADLSSPEVAAMRDQISDRLNQSVARDLFEMFTRAAQAEVGISLNTQVIAAVNAQMQ